MSYAQFGYPAYQPSQLVVGSSSQTSTSAATCCDPTRPASATAAETTPATPTAVCPLPAAYDSRILSTYPRLATGLTATPTFYNSSPYGAEQSGYPNLSAAVDTPFYSTLNTPDPWRGIAQTSPYYYDSTLAAYGYGGLDLNGSRRKNVTRDSTSTLKAWLNEHRKNPYPTKGEKIMLAIITKMTLTQVSTWFANARRRLKKENKMTWEPRNKTEDESEGTGCDRDTDDDQTDCVDVDSSRCIDGVRGGQGGDDNEALQLGILNDGDTGRLDQLTEDRSYQAPSTNAGCTVRALPCSSELKDEHDSGYGGDGQTQAMSGLQSLIESPVKTGELTPKPKIWSLADTATSKSPPPAVHVGGVSSNYCGEAVAEGPAALSGPHCGWFPTPTYPSGTSTTAGHYATNGSAFVHGFSPVPPQTDTPPQTPPSMKLHHGGSSGYLTSQQTQHLYGSHVNGQVDKPNLYHHMPGLGRSASSYRSECLLDDYNAHTHYRTTPIQ